MTLFAHFGDNDTLDETFPYIRNKSFQIIVCTIMTGNFQSDSYTTTTYVPFSGMKSAKAN